MTIYDSPFVKVVEVIEVTWKRGKGLDDSDPMREVKTYYARNGDLLAEFDPIKEERAWKGATGENKVD